MMVTVAGAVLAGLLAFAAQRWGGLAGFVCGIAGFIAGFAWATFLFIRNDR